MENRKNASALQTCWMVVGATAIPGLVSTMLILATFLITAWLKDAEMLSLAVIGTILTGASLLAIRSEWGPVRVKVRREVGEEELPRLTRKREWLTAGSAVATTAVLLRCAFGAMTQAMALGVMLAAVAMVCVSGGAAVALMIMARNDQMPGREIPSYHGKR